MNDLGVLLCNCRNAAQLFFSKQKRNPFVGCPNFQKKNAMKCNFCLDLMENDNLNLLNSKKGKIFQKKSN